MQFEEAVYIYHEKQDAGLCAVHSINALLQGSYFSEIDLAEIAKRFDETEKQMMMEMGTDDPNFLKFMAEDSGNLADDGNYSIQVITKALEIWGLNAVPITSPSMAESFADPLKEDAFICNMSSHWLTIRKIGGIYYNLNSLLSTPQVLSEFYLSAFLSTLMSRGYTIFVIRGQLPRHQPQPTEKNWVRMGPNQAETAPKRRREEEDIEEVERRELAEAIAASMSQGQSGQVMQPIDLNEDDEEDEELAEAIRLSQQVNAPSLTEEPPRGPTATEVAFKLPDGSRITRRFQSTDTLQMLFVFLETKGFTKPIIRSSFPPKILEENRQTLSEAGLHPNASLIVQSR
ncbi:hypothetical protein PROFUN_12963 [Planoprotostelium fungivorum]|uniref:ubiquitinyl hydrolase 1 n=1 Tax=Planoprotostelium fungivorum TaxID=1890364 RepID=A0A2P6MZH7_9EUKA|nr:hypothetical protein PROFUN_12963 [Planoprotostelium fungivorum]